MKSRILWLLSSCVLLVLACTAFVWKQNLYAAPMPEASAMGGYYDSAFTLELSAPKNGRIYYTTDGSTPTADSILYDGGIEIRDRSQEPNLYNAIKNVDAELDGDLNNGTLVSKGTVIRAIFINDRGLQSEIFTQTYFVGIQPPDQGYTLSLIFDYDLLFGDEGIHVTGREYDAWYHAGDPSAPMPEPLYMQDREVMVTAQLLDQDREVLNQPVGLRIQGNSTRGWSKKRFALTARSEYSGAQVFDAELFPGISTHSVMLKDNLPDTMVADLVSDRSVATQRSISVRVFLNGEFWYDSFMLERYDEQYFRQHYKVDNRVLIKDGIMDEESAAAASLNFYDEYMYWVDNTDFSDPLEWEALLNETDLQSYIDYITTNYYLCNWDFSDHKNYVLWRSPATGRNPYEDMRWRWCIYDIDSLEYAQFNADTQNPAQINIFSYQSPYSDTTVNETILFRSLRRNPDFNRQFVLSFMDMVNNNFSPANVQRVLLKYGKTLDWMDGFFRLRPAYAAQHLAEEFELSGVLETVTITTAHPEMGSVTVNTSTINLSDRSWSGQYFTDYPITVTAVPSDGYRFIGWKGGADEAASSITVSVDGSLTLEAVFAEN